MGNGPARVLLLHGGFSIDDDRQKIIVCNVQALLIGAYDADSLLVWVPNAAWVAVLPSAKPRAVGTALRSAFASSLAKSFA